MNVLLASETYRRGTRWYQGTPRRRNSSATATTTTNSTTGGAASAAAALAGYQLDLLATGPLNYNYGSNKGMSYFPAGALVGCGQHVCPAFRPGAEQEPAVPPPPPPLPPSRQQADRDRDGQRQRGSEEGAQHIRGAGARVGAVTDRHRGRGRLRRRNSTLVCNRLVLAECGNSTDATRISVPLHERSNKNTASDHVLAACMRLSTEASSR